MTVISAEAVFENIDVLTEILLRLPAKPLVRFKSVSKQWLSLISSLISDPQSCLSYNRHHHTPAALLLNLWGLTPTIEPVPLKQHSIPPRVPFFYFLNTITAPHIRILHSCNGLFLYEFQKPIFEYTYCVCNPTTKQSKILPFPFPDKEYEHLESACIAFDPLKSNYYKVICVHRLRNMKRSYQVDMYSPETDSWRHLRITFTFKPEDCISISDTVFCNGRVHWYTEDKVDESLYLDVDTECLNTLPMPNLDQSWVNYFGESGGHLHLIVTEKDSNSLQFDVLEMAPDYSEWFVRYHVDLDAARIAFPDIIWNRGFLGLHVHQNQREEESIIVVLMDNEVISYNFHNGTSEKLYDLTHCEDFYCDWSRTFHYFEILTSV